MVLSQRDDARKFYSKMSKKNHVGRKKATPNQALLSVILEQGFGVRAAADTINSLARYIGGCPSEAEDQPNQFSGSESGCAFVQVLVDLFELEVIVAPKLGVVFSHRFSSFQQIVAE